MPNKWNHASTQINLPPDVAEQVLTAGKNVPEEILSLNGRDDNPHISLKYGVEENEELLREAVKGIFPFTVTLGKTKTFLARDPYAGTPLVVEAAAPELAKLNKLIDKAIGNKPEDFSFEPHVTLAYIEEKHSAEYVGKDWLAGVTFTVDSIVLSKMNGEQVSIPLETKPEEEFRRHVPTHFSSRLLTAKLPDVDMKRFKRIIEPLRPRLIGKDDDEIAEILNETHEDTGVSYHLSTQESGHSEWAQNYLSGAFYVVGQGDIVVMLEYGIGNLFENITEEKWGYFVSVLSSLVVHEVTHDSQFAAIFHKYKGQSEPMERALKTMESGPEQGRAVYFSNLHELAAFARQAVEELRETHYTDEDISNLLRDSKVQKDAIGDSHVFYLYWDFFGPGDPIYKKFLYQMAKVIGTTHVASDESAYQAAADKFHIDYKGVAKDYTTPSNALIMYNDPVSGTSIGVFVAEFSEDKVKEHLNAARQRFNLPKVSGDTISTSQLECGWCKKVIREGTQPASHTICPECHKKYFPETLKKTSTKMYSGGRPGSGPGKIVTYFTPNKQMAESYVSLYNDRFGGGGELREADVNLIKPAPYEVIEAEAKKLGIDNTHYTPASIFDRNLHGEKMVGTLVKNLKDQGYDGTILDDIGYGVEIQDKAFIKFSYNKLSPNQPGKKYVEETNGWADQNEQSREGDEAYPELETLAPELFKESAVTSPLNAVQNSVNKFMTEFWPDLPKPKIKIINHTVPVSLGNCLWTSKDPDTSIIEIEKAVCGHQETLDRIVAHELCHHAEYINEIRKIPTDQIKIMNRLHGDHGKWWKAEADKVNNIYGQSYVTVKSDQSMVQEQDKEFYVLLKSSPYGIIWCYAVRPSLKQKLYINHQIPQGAKLVKTKDISLARNPGGTIGSGWRRPGTKEMAEKLSTLWNEVPSVKVYSLHNPLFKNAATDVIGQVYLLHFNEPFKHARHYLGWALDADRRIEQHRNGVGSRLTQVIKENEIGFEVARIWDNATRGFERNLKNQGGLNRQCPVCRALGMDSRKKWKERQEEIQVAPPSGTYGPDYVQTSKTACLAMTKSAGVEPRITTQKSSVDNEGHVHYEISMVDENGDDLGFLKVIAKPKGSPGGDYEEPHLKIHEIFVEEHSRRRGYGTLLYQAARNLARQLGLPNVYSDTTISDEARLVWENKLPAKRFKDNRGTPIRYRMKASSNEFYHVTRYENAANILEHNYFRTTTGQNVRGLSTTKDPNYWWGSKEVRFVLDKQKLSEKYELKSENETIYTEGSLLNENEVVVLFDSAILNARDYILRVDYFEAPGEPEYEDFISQLKDVKSRKIGNAKFAALSTAEKKMVDDQKLSQEFTKKIIEILENLLKNYKYTYPEDWDRLIVKELRKKLNISEQIAWDLDDILTVASYLDIYSYFTDKGLQLAGIDPKLVKKPKREIEESSMGDLEEEDKKLLKMTFHSELLPVKYLLHGTSDKFIADIRKNGLHGKKIYLTTTSEIATSEAEYTVEGDPFSEGKNWGQISGGKPIVIVIDPKKIKLSLRPDPEYLASMKEEGEIPYAFYTRQTVPPSAIIKIVSLENAEKYGVDKKPPTLEMMKTAAIGLEQLKHDFDKRPAQLVTKQEVLDTTFILPDGTSLGFYDHPERDQIVDEKNIQFKDFCIRTGTIWSKRREDIFHIYKRPNDAQMDRLHKMFQLNGSQLGWIINRGPAAQEIKKVKKGVWNKFLRELDIVYQTEDRKKKSSSSNDFSDLVDLHTQIHKHPARSEDHTPSHAQWSNYVKQLENFYTRLKLTGDEYCDCKEFPTMGMFRKTHPLVTVKSNLDRLTDEVDHTYSETALMGMHSFLTHLQDKHKDREKTSASSSFDSWFIGSKVVDAQGKPIICYHGTSQPFSRINMGKGSQGVFWVTSDRSKIERGGAGASSNKHILGMYVNIKKPAGWDEYERLSLGELKRDYDGVILPEGDHFDAIVFKPNQVRMVKSAATDPDAWNEEPESLPKGKVTGDMIRKGAWFLLPDGTWFGVRASEAEHSWIEHLVPEGSIRVPNEMVYDISRKPTEDQKQEIARLVNQSSSLVMYWDIYKDGGEYSGQGSLGDFLRFLSKIYGKTASSSELKQNLMRWRGNIAARAQKVYDEWTQNEEGIDTEYGGGGPCDAIAEQIQDLLESLGVNTMSGGQEGDDHAWIIAYNYKTGEACGVDIPHSVYETGGGYSWKKIPNVVFTPNDVEIWPVDIKDIEYEDQ
jgi:2'-5' RNA ligase/GNAT superfamily N-acetyltransferase/predicted GIY-YIG superfamily endonuclease